MRHSQKVAPDSAFGLTPAATAHISGQKKKTIFL
jgi:hypothetical protein